MLSSTAASGSTSVPLGAQVLMALREAQQKEGEDKAGWQIENLRSHEATFSEPGARARAKAGQTGIQHPIIGLPTRLPRRQRRKRLPRRHRRIMINKCKRRFKKC